MRTELLRFNGAVELDPAIDAWMKEHAGELGAIAHQWFGCPSSPRRRLLVALVRRTGCTTCPCSQMKPGRSADSVAACKA